MITFVMKTLSFLGGGPGSQVSLVVNLDSGFLIFLQLLQAASAPQAPSEPVSFFHGLRGGVLSTHAHVSPFFCIARLCTKTILNDPRRS